MNRRWISASALCIMMLAICVHPSTARLSASNFVPFSQVINNSNENKAKTHQIKKGDTLYRIAHRNEVDLKHLMQINNMDENSILEIGTTIKIPTGKKDGAVHVVAPGETVAIVAQRYGATIVDIMAANQGINPLDIETGDYLIIPNERNKGDDEGITPSRGAKTSGTLLWPITGTISSDYGQRKSGFHHGVDIANKIGTPIRAAESGTVSFAGIKSVYGRTVIVNHPDGKQTLYAHAKSLCVQKGEKVDRGEVIAYVGVSGVTTGPHLHFEVRIDKKTYDPLKYLR